MSNPDIGAVEAALYDDRTVVRHHAMRRTIWVMTPDVAVLAHGAATAKIARAERRRTIAALEDTTDIADAESWLDAAIAEVVALLDGSDGMSTRQIGIELPHLCVPVTFGVRTKNPGSMKAHTKVLQGAGFDATLVRGRPNGTWVSAEYAWQATESWLGRRLDGLGELAAAAELLERWLPRFGPATETDIRWWFGWTAALARKALALANAETVQLEDGSTGFVAPGDADPAGDTEPEPWVQLLPSLDPTAMGWKQRDFYLQPAAVSQLFDQFGNAGHTVWVDGQIVGGWGQRQSGEIVVELNSKLGTAHKSLLDAAIERMAAILGDVVVRPRFPAPLQKQIWGL